MNFVSIDIHTFYFTFMTIISVGYGDISKKNDSERIFSVFTMLTTCALFGIYKDRILFKIYR
jgi:hypothetical protein